MARRIRTGTYGVNAVTTMDIKAPFGGFKASGLGRECGPGGLGAYLETQTIVLPADYILNPQKIDPADLLRRANATGANS